MTVNFVGIGAGKSGSTWLYANIASHPEIFDGAPKEINYFSDLSSEKPLNWYFDLFSKGAGKICGEFSVRYMQVPGTADRIRRALPNTKIIAILRHPLQRAYSDYLHSIRKGDIVEKCSFQEYLTQPRSLANSLYHIQLQQFVTAFPPEQMRLLILEEVQRAPAETFRDLFTWLGCRETTFCPPFLEEKINQATSYRWLRLEHLITRTSRALNRAGHVRLVEAVKRLGLPASLRRMNRAPARSPGDLEVRTCRQDTLLVREITEGTEALLGRRIDAWRTSACPGNASSSERSSQ